MCSDLVQALWACEPLQDVLIAQTLVLSASHAGNSSLHGVRERVEILAWSDSRFHPGNELRIHCYVHRNPGLVRSTWHANETIWQRLRINGKLCHNTKARRRGVNVPTQLIERMDRAIQRGCPDPCADSAPSSPYQEPGIVKPRATPTASEVKVVMPYS